MPSKTTNPGPCVQILVARAAASQRNAAPEQACAAPGILGFIPVGLGCGEYFRFPGSLLEVSSREGEGACFSLFLFSPSACRSDWGLVGSDAVSTAWLSQVSPAPSCSLATRDVCTQVLLWETAPQVRQGDPRRNYSISLSLFSVSSLQFSDWRLSTSWTVLEGSKDNNTFRYQKITF